MNSYTATYNEKSPTAMLDREQNELINKSMWIINDEDARHRLAFEGQRAELVYEPKEGKTLNENNNRARYVQLGPLIYGLSRSTIVPFRLLLLTGLSVAHVAYAAEAVKGLRSQSLAPMNSAN